MGHLPTAPRTPSTCQLRTVADYASLPESQLTNKQCRLLREGEVRDGFACHDSCPRAIVKSFSGKDVTISEHYPIALIAMAIYIHTNTLLTLYIFIYRYIGRYY